MCSLKGWFSSVAGQNTSSINSARLNKTEATAAKLTCVDQLKVSVKLKSMSPWYLACIICTN